MQGKIWKHARDVHYVVDAHIVCVHAYVCVYVGVRECVCVGVCKCVRVGAGVCVGVCVLFSFSMLRFLVNIVVTSHL